MTIQEAIDFGVEQLERKKIESPRLSAELLMAYVTSQNRSQVLANADKQVTNREEIQYKGLLQRRAKNEPVPYITGEVEFYSIPFTISSGVFIPRPETETLVEAALAVARQMDAPKIYDLGIGSGNILISLALNLDDGEFWGSDITNIACQVAQQNVRRHDLSSYVTLKEGPLFTPMRTELTKDFDIIVSNPPYVKTGEIQKLSGQIKDFEPHIALDGGRDGMTFIKSVLDGAHHMLNPGGYIFLEADPTIMTTIRTEVRRRPMYGEFTIHNDASGKERVCQFRTKTR